MGCLVESETSISPGLCISGPGRNRPPRASTRTRRVPQQSWRLAGVWWWLKRWRGSKHEAHPTNDTNVGNFSPANCLKSLFPSEMGRYWPLSTQPHMLKWITRKSNPKIKQCLLSGGVVMVDLSMNLFYLHLVLTSHPFSLGLPAPTTLHPSPNKPPPVSLLGEYSFPSSERT